jgi:1-acyl-sn-glycerol-3-phosphate acyltransferase
MGAFLRGLRSLLALLGIFLLFAVAGLVQRLVIGPLLWLRPQRRVAIMSSFMRPIAGLVLAFVRAGGGEMTRTGFVPTSGPALILMNHQSLLDIPTAVRICEPYTPAFVTRRRYGRLIPMVSRMLALRGCPLVDPEGSPKRAIAVLKRAALEEDHGLLIFPEGHRSRDGEIGAFNTAGARVILRGRRMPVYLVVTDGVFVGRELWDFVRNMHRIRGRTRVLGPFLAPEAEGELEDFVEEMRKTMVDHLAGMRGDARV